MVPIFKDPDTLFLALRLFGLAFLLPLEAGAKGTPDNVREVPIIGLSCALPVVGQSVVISALGEAGRTCEIVESKGEPKTVTFDDQGRAEWSFSQYGKFEIRCGEKALTGWVLASPMNFIWWDENSHPRMATIMMTKHPQYWKSRGVVPVCWAVGEYAAREDGEFKKNPYSKPEQWVENWSAHQEFDGFAMDEIFLGDKPVSVTLARAVAMMRKKMGSNFKLCLYSSGADGGLEDEGVKLLQESNCLFMIESYYGDDKLFLKRWNDQKAYGLEKNAIFAIGVGFKQDKIRGPQTEEAVREEFAKVRRVAPESPGICLYNAFNKDERTTIQPALDEAC